VAAPVGQDQIIVDHPGSGADATWKCPSCKHEESQPRLFLLHWKLNHYQALGAIKIRCRICLEYTGEDARAVGIHQRQCKGPKEEVGDYECPECSRKFQGFPGLQVHRSIKHPTEYQATIEVVKGPAKWSEQQKIELARIEVDVTAMGSRTVNIDIQKRIPYRTVQSISTARRSQDHRSKVEMLKQLARSAEPDTASVEPTPLSDRRAGWSEEERRDLVRAERRLKEDGVRYINVELQRLFPHRTVQSISTMRNKSEYKQLMLEETQIITSNRDPGSLDRHDLPGALTDIPVEKLTHSTSRKTASEYAIMSAAKERVREYLAKDPPETDGDVDKAIRRYIGSISQGGGSEEWQDLKDHLQQSLATQVPRVQTGRRKYRKATQVRRPPPSDENRSTRRRKRFKVTQRAIEKSEGATYKAIMDGTFVYDEEQEGITPPIEEVERVYVDRLETVHTLSASRLAQPEPSDEDRNVYGPIGSREVKRALRSNKPRTAPGCEKWLTLHLARKLGEKKLAMIFNAWYAYDAIPAIEKKCRTILLYKKGPREDVGNWRPITIGSILLRIYAKVWDRRLRQRVTLSSRQKAFVPVDGCFQNIKLLSEAIQESKKKRKEYNLCMLDLAKAFDTVSHSSIEEALTRHGVCKGVPGHIMSMYSGATTTISQNGFSTRPISILNGVKQGCPLSPLLFNLIMDELLNFIDEEPAGIKIGGEKLSIMAFADDLVILTESATDMTILLERCRQFFNSKGLKVNAGKCQGLSAYPLRGRRNHKVATTPTHYWGTTPIPVMDHANTAKYLGCDVTVTGEIRLPEGTWKGWMERIHRAPLKPDQRVRAIRSYLIPRMTHTLRLSDCGRNKLRTWSRIIRKAVKGYLHLPEWTPNSWVHHPNGGKVPDIEECIIRLRQSAATKMAGSEDPIAGIVGTRVLQRNNIKVRAMGLVNTDPKGMKKMMDERRHQALRSTTNGQALAYMAETKRPWLWSGKLWGKTLCNSCKILSGTLPTRINQHRGRCTQDLIRCRRCRATPETDLHVLAECPFNKDAISKRHDRINKKIGKELARRGHEVWAERVWYANQQQLKPDISIITGDTLTIIELTIPYDRGKDTLERREKEKEDKYRLLTPANVPALQEKGVTKVVIKPIVIGASGTMEATTRRNLKSLGLGAHIGSLQLMALAGSANIWQIHEANVDPRPG